MAAPELFPFTEEEIRSWCDGVTVARADALQRTGHVRAATVNGNQMTAEVVGTWTRVDRPAVEQDGMEVRYACTCGSLTLCQHGAAMLLQWIRSPNTFRRPSTAQATFPGSEMLPPLLPEEHLQQLLYRYTMADLRALARRRGLAVKGQLKDEYVQRLATLLLQPETIDPVLAGLEDTDLVVLMLMDVLRDGQGTTVAQIHTGFEALTRGPGARDRDRDTNAIHAALDRLENLGLVIGPTQVGTTYEASRAVTSRIPIPRALIDRLPDRSAAVVDASAEREQPMTVFDLMQILAFEVGRGAVTAQAVPRRSKSSNASPEGWKFGQRHEGKRVKGSRKQIVEGVELLPGPPIIADADRQQLAEQTGASPEQIEFVAEMMRRLRMLLPGDGGQKELVVDDARLRALLGCDGAERRRKLATAWLDLPDVYDFRLLRDVLLLTADVNQIRWYAHELPAQRALRSLVARLIGHLTTAPPRWYASSDLADLCESIAPAVLYRWARSQKVWWFTPTAQPDDRLTLETQDGRRRVYREMVDALIRGPLRWLGMVDVAEDSGTSLFRPRLVAGMLADRETDEESEIAGSASLFMEADPDGTAIVTVSVSGDDAIAMLLTSAAEPLGPSPRGIRYRVTGLVLQHLFDNGLSASDVISWLAGNSKNGVPPVVRSRIDAAWESFGAVRLYDDLTVVELGDDLLIRELQAVTDLESAMVHVFSPRLLAIAAEQVPALLESLSKAGYRPRVLTEP